MHRQSIGSSTGTRHLHPTADEDDEKNRRRSKSSSVNVSIADIDRTEGGGEDDDDEKSSKHDRPFRHNSTERSIHLIPLLTLLCFLVLYMFSHDPSPNDLGGLEGLPAGIESDGTGTGTGTGMGRLSEAAIRSNRRLKELGGRRVGGGRGG